MSCEKQDFEGPQVGCPRDNPLKRWRAPGPHELGERRLRPTFDKLPEDVPFATQYRSISARGQGWRGWRIQLDNDPPARKIVVHSRGFDITEYTLPQPSNCPTK